MMRTPTVRSLLLVSAGFPVPAFRSSTVCVGFPALALSVPSLFAPLPFPRAAASASASASSCNHSRHVLPLCLLHTLSTLCMDGGLFRGTSDWSQPPCGDCNSSRAVWPSSTAA